MRFDPRKDPLVADLERQRRSIDRWFRFILVEVSVLLLLFLAIKLWFALRGLPWPWHK